MRSSQIYPTLVRALEDWRSRPPEVLAAMVGTPPEVGEIDLGGELVRVETSATWADPKQKAVLVEAVAYGPASWLTQRVAEKLHVHLQSPLENGDTPAPARQNDIGCNGR
ncbi:MAG TPA: hypothetical protein VFY22_05490 [Hydrogenophaga sp.]|nr:hypothetical protein [Hydrogenophaga sp.]